MTFRKDLKAPLKPTTPAKWQIPTRRTSWGRDEYYLEGELRDKFVRLFPIHSNARLMRWFGISFSTLQRFKRELGLKKDMKAIRRELARDTKRLCERNGYYASLRGKRPSEACIEASRRKRAEGFNPMLRLKETNPRKFRAANRRRAASWKETRRRDQIRAAYGLPRKTKLALFRTLTHAASSQKSSMIKRLNYFADPGHPTWVCYDSETRRSPRSEATAVRHGLQIVAGEDDTQDTEA